MVVIVVLSVARKFNEDVDKAISRRRGDGSNLRKRTDTASSGADDLSRLAYGNSVVTWVKSVPNNGGRPAVDFPCALHSKNPLQLSDKSTIFFVLSPRSLPTDNHVMSPTHIYSFTID